MLTGAIGHREYHVLGFETSVALRVDFGPFVLLDESGARYAQLQRLCTGPRCGTVRCSGTRRIGPEEYTYKPPYPNL